MRHQASVRRKTSTGAAAAPGRDVHDRSSPRAADREVAVDRDGAAGLGQPQGAGVDGHGPHSVLGLDPPNTSVPEPFLVNPGPAFSRFKPPEPFVSEPENVVSFEPSIKTVFVPDVVVVSVPLPDRLPMPIFRLARSSVPAPRSTAT